MVKGACKRVLIDCDPGIDDALAVLLALNSGELKVAAITTVFGNADCGRTTDNLIRLLETARIRRWPAIGKGSDRPLGRTLLPKGSHGPDGLGNANLPPPRKKIKVKDAVETIISKIRSGGADTIITLGPLTNIAKALRRDRGIARRVKAAFVMAGSLGAKRGPGRLEEFNSRSDPRAFSEILASGMPITLVSLDATTKAVLRGPDLKALTQGGGGGHSELASFIKRAVGYYVEFHRKFRGVRGCYVHDALAVALAIDEGIGSFKELSLGVDLARERGALFVRRGGRPNVRFCRGVDSERFFRLFMKGMRRAILKSRGER